MGKTAIQASTDLANRRGFLYIKHKQTGRLIDVFQNSEIGVEKFKQAAAAEIPVGNNLPAWGEIDITSVTATGAETITSLTIGGIEQLNTPVPFDNTDTPTTLALKIKNEINSFAPTSNDYTAEVNVAKVQVKAPDSLGAAANTHAIVISVSGGTVATNIIDPSGGYTLGNDSQYKTFFIDADYDANQQVGGGTALSTSVGANALEITEVIVPLSLRSASIQETAQLVSGKATFTRKAHFSFLTIESEAGATDDFTDLTSVGVANGDIIVISRKTSGETITVKSTGNLSLAGAPDDFAMASDTDSMFLRYSSVLDKFVEIYRSTVLNFTDAALRTDGISIGKSGSKIFTVLAGGGTDTATPGTTAKNIVIDGNSVTLTSGYTLALSVTGAIDGDPFLIFYINPVTTGGTETVTIGGLTLSDDQATKGIIAMAFYDNVNSAYEVKILVDAATTFVDNEKIPTGEIVETKLKDQGVTPAAYTNANITVTKEGIITAAANGSPASGTNLSKVLWVDTAGNDSTAVKGDLHKAWLSWETAMTAAASGDTIILTPGTHDARSVLKSGVNIYFMEGAKIVYTGASGAVMVDSVATALTIRVSGYPYIEHAGTGTNKNALLLSGTGAHKIEFINAELFGGVVEKVFKINNANAKIVFKDCLFRQSSNIDVAELASYSRVHFYNCWCVGENAGGSAHGIVVGADNAVFDAMRFSLGAAANDAFVAGIAQNLKFFSTIYANCDSGANITNLIVGTDFIKDTDVEFYRT